MGHAKISLEMKIESKALSKANFSQRYISKSFSVSKICVWNVAKTLKQLYLYRIHMVKAAKKASATTTDDRNLLHLCKQDRTKTSQKLSSELVHSNGKQLSARIIPRRRRLFDMGYKSYTAKSKPFRNLSIKKSDFLLSKNIRNG